MDGARLTTLPPELLEQIFRQISDPNDMMRLLTVHRRLAEAVHISFKNIRSLDINYRENFARFHDVYDADNPPYFPMLPTVNGSEVEDITVVVKEMWYRAAAINTLKLNGEWSYPLIEALLPLSLEDGLHGSPHALTELTVTLPADSFYRSNLVQYILKAVSNSLEKFSLSIADGIFEHDGLVDALGDCMRLKVLHLDQLLITQRRVRTICDGKRLESVTISHSPTCYGYPCDSEPFLMTGVLEGLHPDIEVLTLDLHPTATLDEVLYLTVQPLHLCFPRLTKLTLFSYDYYVPSLLYHIRRVLLPTLCLTFPAMQLLRIDHDTNGVLLEHVSDIEDVFTLVLPSLTVERKVRVELVEPQAADERQDVYNMLHAVKDVFGWTVILPTPNEGETAYVGIKKGLLILELSE